jgi:hypothetical protein
VGFALIDGVDGGIDVEGTYRGTSLRATPAIGAVVVACPAPAALAPGHPVRVTLGVDMSGWFSGVDLSAAHADGDDVGLSISNDDNPQVAAMLLGNVVRSFRLDCFADGQDGGTN